MIISQKTVFINIYLLFDMDLEEFKDFFVRLNMTPREKYSEPQTSSQEYGWQFEPLVSPILDGRFHHPKLATEISR